MLHLNWTSLLLVNKIHSEYESSVHTIVDTVNIKMYLFWKLHELGKKT